jgi:hypothetical protein
MGKTTNEKERKQGEKMNAPFRRRGERAESDEIEIEGDAEGRGYDETTVGKSARQRSDTK